MAARLDPAQLLPDASLGDQNLIAALRPLAVDLLTATGMTERRGAGLRAADLRRDARSVTAARRRSTAR